MKNHTFKLNRISFCIKAVLATSFSFGALPALANCAVENATVIKQDGGTCTYVSPGDNTTTYTNGQRNRDSLPLGFTNGANATFNLAEGDDNFKIHNQTVVAISGRPDQYGAILLDSNNDEPTSVTFNGDVNVTEATSQNTRSVIVGKNSQLNINGDLTTYGEHIDGSVLDLGYLQGGTEKTALTVKGKVNSTLSYSDFIRMGAGNHTFENEVLVDSWGRITSGLILTLESQNAEPENRSLTFKAPVRLIQNDWYGTLYDNVTSATAGKTIWMKGSGSEQVTFADTLTIENGVDTTTYTAKDSPTIDIESGTLSFMKNTFINSPYLNGILLNAKKTDYAATLNNNGTLNVISQDDVAIKVNAVEGTTAIFNNTENGSVDAMDGKVVEITPTHSGTFTLNNAGNLSSSTAVVDNQSENGIVEITNSGTLDGTILTTENGNTQLNNSGIWFNRKNNSNLTQLINSGAIKFAQQDNEPGRTITVSEDYQAEGENATLEMNTKLGADDSVTDRLIVKGNTSGKTAITVVNQDGKGDLTNDGIKLIEVAGSSDAGNFNLANSDELKFKTETGQTLAYDLYKGKDKPEFYIGELSDTVEQNSWYLRSYCADGSQNIDGNNQTGNGLGCYSDDKITLTGTAELTKVEGAGGSDTILIEQNAQVNGNVYGGNAGFDNSQEKDGNDVITIADNAKIAGTVFGQKGDDQINWLDNSSIEALDGGEGSDTVTVSSVQYNGSQLLDGGDDTSAEDAQIDTLNLNTVTAEVDGSKLLNWETINLNGSDLTLTGTLITGTASDGKNMGLHINDNAVLGINNSATVRGDVYNRGTIDLTRNSSTGQTLHVEGNYSATNAVVKMNTVWNAPGGENGEDSESDQLFISGKASGSTTIIPVKADGTLNIIEGTIAQVSKVLNSLPVVTVGLSGETAFIGTAKTDGASEVQLAKRTINGKDEYFWTLTALEPEPTPEPIYDSRVPAYVQMPLVNMEQGYTTVGTLHERRSENHTLAWTQCSNECDEKTSQTWGRVFGRNVEIEGKKRLGFDTDIYGIQIGHDFDVKHTSTGERRLTGAYIAYSQARTDFNDKYRTVNGIIQSNKLMETGRSDAWSLGLTQTRYASNGSYLDLIAQASIYRNTYKSRIGEQVKQNGYGVLASAETGYPYALAHTEKGNAWVLEPQMQLVYQMVDLNGFHDGIRRVEQGDQHALRGRIGLRLAHNHLGAHINRNDTFYMVANIWKDFRQPSGVQIGSDYVREKYATTWGEIGLGTQFSLSKHSYIYSDVRFEHSLGNSNHKGYRASLGLKYSW